MPLSIARTSQIIRQHATLLQEGDPLRKPLFLIHGAGGTVHSYHKLNSISRTVYAIANPWLDSETRWEGGTMRLVEEYARIIKQIVPEGQILLGGWSLGGQLSVDIARVLALESPLKIQVMGIVLIDTVYPYWGPPETSHSEFAVDLVLRDCPRQLRAGTLRCMKWSKEDSSAWVRRNWMASSQRKIGIESKEPPPAVLIRASRFVPCKRESVGPPARALVDTYREQKNGWRLFPHQGFISAVWDVPAHHFELFDGRKVEETSDMVRMACDMLAGE